MFETAILTSCLSLGLAIFFAHQSKGHRTRTDISFILFGVTGTFRFLNLFLWLNLTQNLDFAASLDEHLVEALIPPVRSLDFILGLCIFILGLEMLHAGVIARVKEVNPWARRFTYLLPTIAAPILLLLIVLYDHETSRRFGLIFFPFGVIIMLYYLSLFRNNPLKISKPEFIKGSMLVTIGYLGWVLSEGALAGILRLLEPALAFIAVAVAMIAAGGVVQGTVTFTGLYSRLRVGIIIVDREKKITLSNLGDSRSSIAYDKNGLRLAKMIVNLVSQVIDDVFEQGFEKTLPYMALNLLNPERFYQIDVIPHQLDSEANPITVMIVINDVTSSVEERQTEQLNDLLNQVLVQKNKAEFYLDLLGHDMSNLLQGIVLGLEMTLHENSLDPSFRVPLDLAKEQVDRAIEMLWDVKMLADSEQSPADLKPLHIPSILKKSIKTARKLLADQFARVNIDMQKELPHLYAEEVIERCFANIIVYFHRIRGEDPVHIQVNYEVGKSFVEFDIARKGPCIPNEIRERIFDWQLRSSQPSAGVGLPLAKALVLKYGGTISTEDRIPDKPDEGVKFVIRLPVT